MKVISIDASVDSDLDWDFSVETGDSIQWNIECGLFDRLPRPIEDEMQFRTLELALQHFCDTVWEPYRSQTHAVCLYRGSANFSDQIKLDPISSRDITTDYLRLLTETMPEEMPLMLELDVTEVEGFLLQAQLLSRSRFERFKLKVIGAKIPTYVTGNEKIAVCLPNHSGMFPQLDLELERLSLSKIPYRIIPEAFLTQEWNGLDEWIVARESVGSQGLRMIQGFVAAGGTVTYLE